MPPSTEELLQSTDTLVVLASVSSATSTLQLLLSVLLLPSYNCARAIVAVRLET
jgi:alkanesulfonate monooxygenase SsuD/methylene tetrahydromethanopterin reductase-like flavin-dependent oxidoreductase (luciferase family)